MTTKKLSTESYKGVRDFYPEDQAVERYIFDTWRNICEQFGYSEYHASILEPTELYTSKTSDEIVNDQTYTFEDRGGRSVTLRPEMTPSVARLVAGKKRDLPFPLRWYSIPNVFRYERPQRGRLREHWQLNVDIFGIEHLQAEVEIIAVASAIMHAFGATAKDFAIRINNRGVMNTFLQDTYELDEAGRRAMLGLIDRKNKIDDFDIQAENIAGKPFTFDGIDTTDVDTLTTLLKNRGIENVVFDPTLVRGFDYYTGIVFEFFDTDPTNNRSVLGGGRYDRLLELFDDEKIPAVGFGMGDVTIRDFLETRNLLPEYHAPAHIFLCTLSSDYLPQAHMLAETLRANSLNVEINLSDKKVSDQIKFADKKKIPYIICIGEQEANTQTYTLKELETGKETTVHMDNIAEIKDAVL